MFCRLASTDMGLNFLTETGWIHSRLDEYTSQSHDQWVRELEVDLEEVMSLADVRARATEIAYSFVI